jgi:hypothetical protein
MTSYLQRLFDRATGLAGGAATALSPTFPSRSPVAEADQRLNVPDLAASLFALPPGFDARSASEDEALTGIEEAAASPIPPDRPVRTPAAQAREGTNIAGTETPPREPRSATPQYIPQPPRERRAPVSADEPASRQERLEPIPPSPQVLPEKSVKAAPRREALQPRQTEISATPLELSPMPTAAKTEERAIRQLEPLPLSAPDPLPLPTSPPRDVAASRQPTVTRREIVTAPLVEPMAQPPSRMMPATAESVSRIGKLMPRRRAQLVFGLRRR